MHGQINTHTAGTPGAVQLPGTDQLISLPLVEEPEVVTIEQVLAAHEGADPLLRHDLFIAPTEESQRLGLVASSREGAIAVAAGEAIWRSIASDTLIDVPGLLADRKSTRLNSSHVAISYAVFCLKKKI